MAHLYASFADAAQAEKAAGALLDYGVRKEDVSLVANDAYGHSRSATGGVATDAGQQAALADDVSTTETAAKHGLSTTTPEDAGEGAVKGAGIGLGVGVAAALASLLVPGVGLVIGGGALASALGGAALTAGAGAVAGGVTGYLKEQGVPDDAAQRYRGTVESGGAVLSVNVPSGNVDQATAEGVLSKYGASDVNSY